MPTLLLIFLFYSQIECSDVAVRPVVTFTPNWGSILMYESMMMTCHVGSTTRGNQVYYWYKDRKLIPGREQNLSIKFADEHDRGEYQCRTNTSQQSHPVRLDVFNSKLILQSPLVVYEGDPLTLRCHSYPGYNATNTTFYLNGIVIKSSETDNRLNLPRVDFGTSRTYSCTRNISLRNRYKMFTSEATIYVQKRNQVIPKFTWLLLLLPLFLIFFIGLLLFKFRYKLSPLIRGRLQNYPVTEQERQNQTEQNKTLDVHYTYVDIDHSQGVCPVPIKPNDEGDYSIIYSLVTHADTVDEKENASETTIYEVLEK